MNDSHYFITGSWDNYQNSIKLWIFKRTKKMQKCIRFRLPSAPTRVT
jgi:hypothetical protein